VLDAFKNNRIGSFARIVMVNPLYNKLPCLVLVICYTYNCFDTSWVRGHWGRIQNLWNLHYLEQVGPIIGHA
jgi:hypothetical protein